MDGTLAEIRGFAGDFAPRQWEYCDGQLLAIAEFNALYALLGITFGGDGRNNFALPDLRGRVLIHQGTNPYTETEWVRGYNGGFETIKLKVSDIPSHTHAATTEIGPGGLTGSATAQMFVNNGSSDTQEPSGKFIGVAEGGNDFANSKDKDDSTLNTDAIKVDTSGLNVDVSGIKVDIGDTGGNGSHFNMQPYLVVSWIICIEGEFPQRW